MIYSGVPDNKWAASGAAILIRKDWKNKIQDYTWISDRIVVTRLSQLNRNFTIVGGICTNRRERTRDIRVLQ
jgi:hypothetical protein